MDTQKAIEALDRMQVALDVFQSRVELVQITCLALGTAVVAGVAFILLYTLLPRKR